MFLTQEKATESEAIIRSITSQFKALDLGKDNVARGMTMLKMPHWQVRQLYFTCRGEFVALHPRATC